MSSLLFYNVENSKEKPLNEYVSKLLTGTVHAYTLLERPVHSPELWRARNPHTYSNTPSLMFSVTSLGWLSDFVSPKSFSQLVSFLR
jgi:hypothetical protein